MSRNVVETVLGAVVLIIAAVFLVFSYTKGEVGEINGYKISAEFSGIGGLKIGDAVQISGVNIGKVADVKLNPEAYVAVVTMDINPTIKIPSDSTAMISSESLLGGKYLLIEPGGAEDMLVAGGKIEYTQAPQNLEQLLGKFIFSQGNKKEGEGDTASSSDPEAP
jgi:phospholipid/cholesterol/gamma-HCH transport system substrate-binding protein